MSSNGTAPRASEQRALSLTPARAAASRRNGAKSKGPKSVKGKARSAQNALKHGLCATRHAVLPDEDGEAFAALEAALFEELDPKGALQRLLAGRIARAAWRLERAERIEAELFEERSGAGHWAGAGGVALALIRDGNSTRSFDTLLRYRGSALAELWRALRTLKALQSEGETPSEVTSLSQRVEPSAVLEHPPVQPNHTNTAPALVASPTVVPPFAEIATEIRNEPKTRRKPIDSNSRTVKTDAESGTRFTVSKSGLTASHRR
ncbi:MAG: hypothetical protein AAF637_16305 [Pseudomonadota bacterium]